MPALDALWYGYSPPLKATHGEHGSRRRLGDLGEPLTKAKPIRPTHSEEAVIPGLEVCLLPTGSQNRTSRKADSKRQISGCIVTCRFSVGVAGFEPAASSSRTKRAAKLRHTPAGHVVCLSETHRPARKV
jgi:hypothetical protein